MVVPSWHSLQRRRQWWVLFGLLALITIAWSMATPALSGADELAHVRRAEAIVRGQLLGRHHVIKHGRYTEPFRVVRVPATFAHLDNRLFCYLANLHASARCAEPVVRSPQLVPQATYVGEYPPLYYLLVGWPALLARGVLGVYAMRVLSALWSSLFLATALWCALGTGRRFAALGVAAATTPFVTYIAGTINPSGLEISTAICLWACGVEFATRSARSGERKVGRQSRASCRSLLVWSCISGAMLLAMRFTSVVWFVLIAVALGIWAGAAAVKKLSGRHDARVWLAITGAVGIASSVWIVSARSWEVLGWAVPRSWSTWTIITDAAGRSWLWLKGMLAATTLGLPAFEPVVVLVLGIVVVLFYAALAITPQATDISAVELRRRKTLVLGLLLVVAFLPIVVASAASRSIGSQWQGRYGLPLAAGIPILSGWLAADAPALRGRRATSMAGLAIVVWCGATILDLFWTMRRYAVGVGGPIWFFPGEWQPRLLPALAVLIVATVAGLALAAVVCGLTPPVRSGAREDRRVAATAVGT